MKTLLACALMAASACVADGQPVQWRVEDGGNGHWYELRVDERSWQAGRGVALSLGGDLASLEVPAEWNWVASRFDSGPGGDMLVGGVQIPNSASVDTGWFWLTGAPVFGIPTDFDDNECGVSVPGVENNEQNLLHLAYWGTKIGDINDRTTDARCGTIGAANPRRWLIEWSADCNGDGIVDKGQILSGQLPDANNNGIPDWSVNIITQPTNQSVGVDQPVYFSVEVSSTPNCTNPINYRWQRRNPVVLDDNAPNAWIDLQDGGGFLNTATASMTILRPTAGLATGYRCKISGGCGCEGLANGVVYTNIVNFAPACPSDFNNDGSVDGDDVIAFFERWDGGC